MAALHGIEGGAKSVEELERDAAREILALAETHLAALKAAGSPWSKWLRSIRDTAEDLMENRDDEGGLMNRGPRPLREVR